MMSNQTIEVLKAESAELRGLADTIDELIAKLQIRETGKSASKNGVSDLAGLTQVEVCSRILAEEQPLTREEIFKRANERGANLKHLASLASVLSRDDRFHSVSRGLWGLAKPAQT
jgi:hypothetical protein